MKRLGRTFRIVGLLAIVSSLFAQSAFAQTNPGVNTGTVPTNAQIVAGSGIAPRIECKWELPDMQPGVSVATSFPDPAIQYNSGTGATQLHHHDDNDALKPDGDPATAGTQVPCDVVRTGGVVTGAPKMPGVRPAAALGTIAPDAVHHMTQVKPNAHDEVVLPGPVIVPEQRKVQLWLAAEHDNGISNISDVFWKVFHGNGSFKIQVHQQKINVADCAAMGTSAASSAGKMFEAAVDSGQLSAAAVDDPNWGMIALCQEQQKGLYYASFDISKHQPCGEYRIEAHAVALGGAEAIIDNYIDVICFYNLELDFNTVDWGTMTPGLSDVVNGNLLWEPPASTKPTVRNTGNAGMSISVTFSDMLQQGVPGPKKIDQFDVCFGVAASRLVCIDPLFSNSAGNLLTAAAGTAGRDVGDVTLCANRLGKLDLSIHPTGALPAGTYAGTVTINAVASPICLTDDVAGGRAPDTTTVTDASLPTYPGSPIGDGLLPAYHES